MHVIVHIKQWNNVLLKSPIFTNESSIDCSNIIKHDFLFLVKYYILVK